MRFTHCGTVGAVAVTCALIDIKNVPSFFDKAYEAALHNFKNFILQKNIVLNNEKIYYLRFDRDGKVERL
jgi:hypothetical protein